MKLEEIKELAKQHNIKTGKLKKAELVRAIQEAEKNDICFDTGTAARCGQETCAWRDDCQ
jgi:murein tripeptide amidase MpaA